MPRWLHGLAAVCLFACATGGENTNPNACGGVGQACCAPSTGASPCERTTLQCESADQTCRLRAGEGSCAGPHDCFGTAQCDAANARCCLPDGVFSNDPTLCCSGFADRRSECTAYPTLDANCGRAGMECCDLSAEVEELIGTRCPGEGLGSSTKLMCSRGFCYECGGPGQPCCNGGCERGMCRFDVCGSTGPSNTTWCDEAGETCCRNEDGSEMCAGSLSCVNHRCSTRAPGDECDELSARGCEACAAGRTSDGRFCGWCGDRCVSGSAAGSVDGMCTPMRGNWIESVSQCPAPRFCSELRSCDACAGGGHGLDCVWCDRPTGGSTAPSCVSGSSNTAVTEHAIDAGLMDRSVEVGLSVDEGGCVDEVQLSIASPSPVTGLTFAIIPPAGARTSVTLSDGSVTSSAFRGRSAGGLWRVTVSRSGGDPIAIQGTFRVTRTACTNLCGSGDSEVVRDASMCR